MDAKVVQAIIPTKDVFLALMLISYSIAEFCFLLLSSDRGYKPGWVGVGLGKKRQQGVKSSRPVTELPCPHPRGGQSVKSFGWILKKNQF